MDLKDRISKVFVETLQLDIAVEEVVRATRLDELVSFDSVSTIEFVVGLEREFGIIIDLEGDQIDVLKDADQLAVYIEKAMEA